MSKKTVIESDNDHDSISSDPIDWKKIAEEREAQVKALTVEAEEHALARVCAAMGIDPKRLKEKESEKPKQMIEMHVQTEVLVNGKRYVGRVVVDYELSKVLGQAIGDRRMRLLRELTGSKYIIDELSNGTPAPRLVEQTTEDGAVVTGRNMDSQAALHPAKGA